MNEKCVELLTNLDSIHTTKLGEERIKRNLKINSDVITFVKSKVNDNNALIYKKGKNYYCEIGNIRITINSFNYCIITAHII